MTKLEWNGAGERRFELGIDQGVLFPPNAPGVAWNGLLSVREQPAGGEPTPYYMDGVKYMNRPAVEEYAATLDAYTYPDEFEPFDGYADVDGISLAQQTRREFNLCYRTLLGNDVMGQSYGYRIHLIYNILASPTNREYKTIGSTVDPMTMSWSLTTTPLAVPGFRPTSHFIINSTKIPKETLEAIEGYLYGSEHNDPTLFHPLVWMDLAGGRVFETEGEYDTGLWPVFAPISHRDVIGRSETGYFRLTPATRLRQVAPGLYRLAGGEYSLMNLDVVLGWWDVVESAVNVDVTGDPRLGVFEIPEGSGLVEIEPGLFGKP